MKKTWALIISILGCCLGCVDDSIFMEKSVQAEKREEAMRDFEQSMQEAENITPPDAVLTIQDVVGWERTAIQALPPEDNGFSVGFHHPEGITVTLYQYTAGVPTIPKEIDSPVIASEMFAAKDGIRQLVDLGYYETATESDSGYRNLGTSSQSTAWSRYRIEASGNSVISETYIWPVGNTIHKLRCTRMAQATPAVEKALNELLTAIGVASGHVK